ncbi:23S rRNA (guanosine2251-2'-O)-methyltransferase [Trueperella bonasi]|uniref:23S rRNA (Guanosine2251-2'-O)-methyltransferase n=1 Tax=Trueperella bonasi TaxID=312286 RepID=A0ABT9NFQ9_9ACTO|nr:23S rRNA (guanosine(2251)-2'-O)-methyltransferase RlmB [Trueperella bonasi]MDP9806212.1 23S rRNA (guanosine2251-2'-O)-methyltransferase [Trueperella bonasi]
MANHRGRPGAVRKNARKGSTKGTGGHNRRRLEGKGPTPKAEDRTYHPAHQRKKAREAAAKRAAGPKLRGILKQPEGFELVAGRNPVYEAVLSGIPYERVFLVSSMTNDERVAEVARAAMANGTPLVEVTRAELDKMTDGQVHQGIAIEVPPHSYVQLEDLVDHVEESGRPGLIVALDSVTDPHNLGAVMRSAAAFRANGVLIPERRSASVNATVWKVSAGAVARIPVARETNLVRSLKDMQKRGYFVVGLAGDADADVSGVDLADVPLVLVTGSEGGGLSRLVRETCDVVASIPIDGETESLNAAVATGIALYQIDQKRRNL